MKKIEIKNFGVVTDAILDLESPISVIIGPQASGKSTISKVVYFVSLLGNIFKNVCCMSITGPETRYMAFERQIRLTFRDTFGDFKSLGDFEITADLDDVHTFTLHNAGIYIGMYFSTNAHSEVLNVMEEMDRYLAEIETSDVDTLDIRKIKMRKKRDAERYFASICPDYLCKNEALYMPAGRSALTCISRTSIKDFSANYDYPTVQFLGFVNDIKDIFNNGIEGFVREYCALNPITERKKELSEKALEIIKRVLRAEYIYSDNSESLRVNEKTQIAIRNASSGQQEILWPLILILIQMLDNLFPIVVFEEPEAHLYPESQLQIMKLIAMMVNETDCRVLITTHSPYVLSSTNLLIQSGRVENMITAKSINPVIDEQCRLDSRRVSAYKIDDGTSFDIRSIIDENTGLIESYEIDTVSERINKLSGKLIELEIEHDL